MALPRTTALHVASLRHLPLDDVLADLTHDARVPKRVESWVLKLVVAYQALRDDQPQSSRDVNLIRRELRLRWSARPEQQDMLETFLQVLVDEEFLVNLNRPAGRVLIVDAQELSHCTMAPPLINAGYDVIAVPDARAAEEVLGEFAPDLMIVSIESGSRRALRLCEKIKGEVRTQHTPILALVAESDHRLAVQALRAGADDFLSQPVNIELLFFKVQARLAAPLHEIKECGVSGSLHEMTFTDMIQILCAGQKNVDILLHAEDEEGSVFIRDGDVVHAAVGEDRGEAAFYRLMRWQDGQFTTRQCSECPARTIHQSTMSLLMEGARLADEA